MGPLWPTCRRCSRSAASAALWPADLRGCGPAMRPEAHTASAAQPVSTRAAATKTQLLTSCEASRTLTALVERQVQTTKRREAAAHAAQKVAPAVRLGASASTEGLARQVEYCSTSDAMDLSMAAYRMPICTRWG